MVSACPELCFTRMLYSYFRHADLVFDWSFSLQQSKWQGNYLTKWITLSYLSHPSWSDTSAAHFCWSRNGARTRNERFSVDACRCQSFRSDSFKIIKYRLRWNGSPSTKLFIVTDDWSRQPTRHHYRRPHGPAESWPHMTDDFISYTHPSSLTIINLAKQVLFLFQHNFTVYHSADDQKFLNHKIFI